MRKKLFTLLLAVAASVGTMFAWDYERVPIGYLYYNLDATNQTAEVTRQNSGKYSGDIVIPSSITYYNSVSYSVTSIGDGAFYECTSLTSVTIPNSVTNIGGSAFSHCSGLTSVTIPNSVTSIGNNAFSYCSSLTSVTIPNSVTSIGNDAFSYCSSLTSVTIGNSVISIGDRAFYDCTSLTSVTIGNSVTSIGDRAFYDCTSLTSVTITDIAAWCNIAFSSYISNPLYYAEHLYVNNVEVTNLVIPNSVTSIGDYAFYNCHSLTSVTIPNSVTSIGNNAFYYCSGLTSVTIPNSVTSIGGSAFSGCSGLTSVTIPNSVTSIGGSAFYDCSGLTSLVVQNPNLQIEGEYYSSFLNSTALKYISAPACIFDIHSNYTSYPSYFPQKLDSIKVIGGELSENALWVINLSRKTLQSVDLSGTAHTDLADEAFKEFYNLRKLILPANLTHIGYKSVAECVKLQFIDIPASVEEIDDRAFEDCRSIQTITFGGSSAGAPGRFNAPATASQLRRIGNWAFYNAHELQNLVIPEGVTEIGDGAFYGCTYLEEMVLPSSVQSIGDNCFALCAKLTKITCNAVTPPTIQAKTFFDVKRQIPVYVPDEAVSAYENDTYWQEFDIQGQSEAPQGVENVQSNQVPCTKVVRDGQIFILRGDKTYTLQGQEVK